jgi:hypothetical protein
MTLTRENRSTRDEPCKYTLSTKDPTKTGLGWTRASFKGGSWRLTVWPSHLTRAGTSCLTPLYASWCRCRITLQTCLQPHFSDISQTAQINQFQNKKWTNYCAISRVICTAQPTPVSGVRMYCIIKTQVTKPQQLLTYSWHPEFRNTLQKFCAPKPRSKFNKLFVTPSSQFCSSQHLPCCDIGSVLVYLHTISPYYLLRHLTRITSRWVQLLIHLPMGIALQ